MGARRYIWVPIRLKSDGSPDSIISSDIQNSLDVIRLAYDVNQTTPCIGWIVPVPDSTRVMVLGFPTLFLLL
jgi:hypothetical protein